jgi:small subunit ribosomal protein S8
MYPIANMLIQIKNAQARGLEEVVLPFSKIKFDIARILKEKGFVEEVEKRKKKLKKAEVNFLAIRLKYSEGAGAIQDVKLISKPSRRVYAGKSELYQVKSGFGISVISTSKGVMTGEEARKNGIGGEVIFEIW